MKNIFSRRKGMIVAMGKTFRAKLMLFAGILIMSVLLCQVIFNVWLSKSYFIHQKKIEVEKLFATIQNHYTDDADALYELTRKPSDSYGLNILIFDGENISYSNRNIGGPAIRGAAPGVGVRIVNADLFLETPSAILTEGRGQPMNMDSIALYGKFEYEGRTRYVLIETPVESIDASIRVLTTVNGYISAAILCPGLVFAWFFAKRFSKPIQNIQEVAQNVANLDFSSRADEELSTTELRELSVHINAMSDQISGLIADLRASNEALQKDVDHQKRLDRMRREFVANVSHELKTPLCLLMMYSENLKNNLQNIDKDYYCDTIIEEAARMNDMVVNLLSLSAMENGLSDMKLEPVGLSDLMTAVLAKSHPLLEGFALELEIAPDIEVKGNAMYLEQAIKNYLTNALSYTPPGGKIAVSLEEKGENAVVTVYNQGAAIAEADLSRIWESFYKADKARVRTEENHTGLGLYIVKTIMEAHQGEYGAYNCEEGVTFWFSVPLA